MGRGCTQTTLKVIGKLEGDQSVRLLCESDSTGSSDGTLKVKLMPTDLGVDPGSALEEEDWLISERGGVGLLGPLGGRSLCPKGVLVRPRRPGEAEYGGCTCKKQRRGDVRGNLPGGGCRAGFADPQRP